MKKLNAILITVLLATTSVFASTENVGLIDDVVRQSGLENSLKENPADLIHLKAALLKAIRKDADAKDFVETTRDIFIPQATKIKNEPAKNHQFQVIQYNLLIIAGENGY